MLRESFTLISLWNIGLNSFLLHLLFLGNSSLFNILRTLALSFRCILILLRWGVWKYCSTSSTKPLVLSLLSGPSLFPLLHLNLLRNHCWLFIIVIWIHFLIFIPSYLFLWGRTTVWHWDVVCPWVSLPHWGVLLSKFGASVSVRGWWVYIRVWSVLLLMIVSLGWQLRWLHLLLVKL